MCRAVLKFSVLSQIVVSEVDSDMDTGFYSDDDEEDHPSKRRSLLVALRCGLVNESCCSCCTFLTERCMSVYGFCFFISFWFVSMAWELQGTIAE